jgi:hypothetical protein
VGLRLYGNRPGSAVRSEEAYQVPEPAECSKTEPVKPVGQITKGEQTAQTPEEQAAGRAEAAVQLASAATLGYLETRAAQTEKSAKESEKDKKSEAAENSAASRELTEEEKEQVQELKARDREVRAHEAAHMAASGGLAGSPAYTYQTGPDGQRYAIGGEVSVKSRATDDPAKALSDAEAVKRAAQAPADPSSQDRAVASAAAGDIARLKSEVRKEDEEKAESKQEESEARSSPAQVSDSGGHLGYNGETFSRKVSRAYEAVKSSFPSSLRPVLARI